MKIWKVALVAGAVALAGSFLATPFSDNASKEKELACPREPEPWTHVVLQAGPSSTDQVVTTHGTEKASLVIYPGSPQRGDLRVCGEGGTFVQLAEVTGRVLVAGNGAKAVREESLPAPKLQLKGTGAEIVLCARDGVKSANPSCKSFIKDARGLRW